MGERLPAPLHTRARAQTTKCNHGGSRTNFLPVHPECCPHPVCVLVSRCWAANTQQHRCHRSADPACDARDAPRLARHCVLSVWCASHDKGRKTQTRRSLSRVACGWLMMFDLVVFIGFWLGLGERERERYAGRARACGRVCMRGGGRQVDLCAPGRGGQRATILCVPKSHSLAALTATLAHLLQACCNTRAPPSSRFCGTVSQRGCVPHARAAAQSGRKRARKEGADCRVGREGGTS